MTDLPALKEDFLPDTIEQLTEFVLIGQERLKAFRLKVRAIDKLKVAQEVRDQTVEDGQRAAEAVLWAEAKLGELLKPLTEHSQASSARGTRSLPEGITKKQSHEAQELARNPEIIKDVIEEAKEEKDIPTKRDVLQKIQKEKKKKRIKKIVNEEYITSESFLQSYNNFYDEVIRAMHNDFKETSKVAILARLEILKNIVKPIGRYI